MFERFFLELKTTSVRLFISQVFEPGIETPELPAVFVEDDQFGPFDMKIRGLAIGTR
ncbi:MAG: hypothetical protein ABIJ35_10240 [Acidobacteriota bacterium]